MHSLGIVHRDLNPSNLFLHFPDLPEAETPPPDGAAEQTFDWGALSKKSTTAGDGTQEGGTKIAATSGGGDNLIENIFNC